VTDQFPSTTQCEETPMITRIFRLLRGEVLLLAFLVFVDVNSLEAQWVETNGPSAGYIRCVAVSGTNLFAGTSSGGVFLSTNDGTSWNAANAGLAISYILTLAVSDSSLFAGTMGGGVWKRPLSQMLALVERNSTDLPAQYILGQNYPNPFNPKTKIGFGVSGLG
jgi:hypothetical protein